MIYKIAVSCEMYFCIYVKINLSIGFQLTVTVRDLGTPSRAGTNTASVTISVYRNQFDPQFLGLPYETTINRNVNTDSSVYRFSVTDQDSQVSLLLLSFEPRREKTGLRSFNQVRHKPDCTVTEDCEMLGISDLGSRGIVQSV